MIPRMPPLSLMETTLERTQCDRVRYKPTCPLTLPGLRATVRHLWGSLCCSQNVGYEVAEDGGSPVGVKPSSRWLEASRVRREVFANHRSRHGRSEPGSRERPSAGR